MTYTIQPGVKQGVKRNGKYYLFQLATYPNGKVIEVPYADTGAEPGYTIPLPVERQLRARPAQAVRAQVVQRFMVIDLQWKGQSHISKSVLPNSEGQRWVERELLPLMRWDGKAWIAIETQTVTWFNQHHRDQGDYSL